SMREPARQAVFGRRFLRHLWRLLRIYWTSEEARWGALLLAGAITLELGAVYGNLLLSEAERRVLGGLHGRHAPGFFAALGLFVAISAAFVLVSTYRIYLRQLLEIRWRRGTTAHFVGRWITARAYPQAQLHADELDNPDQRVTEDVRDFVASALGLS